MTATTAKFNVGGTVFDVAVSTIQSQPEGLLSKMIDGRFPCGKDESGAFFVDRNPRFFDIVLDVHRDNKVYALSPGVTRERVLAELEFYGLQDFEGVSMDLSSEATLRSAGDVSEGFARLLLAEADLVKDPRSTTFKCSALNLKSLPGVAYGCVIQATQGVQRSLWEEVDGTGFRILKVAGTTDLGDEIIKFCAQWNLEATLDAADNNTTVAGKSCRDVLIKLTPIQPIAAGISGTTCLGLCWSPIFDRTSHARGIL